MKAMRDVWRSVLLSGLVLCGALSSGGYGVFSASEPLGNGNLDASVGLNAAKSYTHAYNIRGVDLSINGVVFTGVSNYTGVEGSFGMSGFGDTVSGGSVIGVGSALNTLLNTFNYKNAAPPLTLSLTNLVVGESYILSLYNKSWGLPGADRVQSLSSSSGAAGIFDENMGGEPNANLLRYTFAATNLIEWIKFTRLGTGSFHFYGFTVEQVFNNSWTAGAVWSTATWGTPGVPDAVGASADFPTQGAPTAIELDVPVTVGHLQFDGAQPWTLGGTHTLTLQADVGGVSVLSALAGAHTISSDIYLPNRVMKTGGGTLTLAGVVSGSGSLTVGAGTLEITVSNTLPAVASVEIAAGAVMKLSNLQTQKVALLSFDNVRQRRGTWGAPGSGAQYTSERFSGAGLLEVLNGPAMGAFTASGNLGGGNLDAAVGLDPSLNYISAVNTFGGALTVNGVLFGGSIGGNPAGVSYSTANFGSWNNTPQSVVTDQLGLMLNDFNYGNGTTPQSLTLRNLVAGHPYTLTFYNRAWDAFADRTQIFTTTSGATTTFNADDGAVSTASWLRYTFVASGFTETITITPTTPRSFHLYGFTLTREPAENIIDLTRRDSGAKVIEDNLLADLRVIEGTGTPGDISVAKYETTINSLTQSAADGLTTVALAGKVLAVNSLVTEGGAGTMSISNGIIQAAGTTLQIETSSSNPLLISAVIGNGAGANALQKSGAGTLTLSGANSYSGRTTVYEGTLQITGGKIGGGVLTVDGATLQIDGGTVTSDSEETYWNSTVNQTAGVMNHGFYFKPMNTVFNLTGGSSGCGGEALLGINGGTNATVNISGSHIADWYVTRFSAGNANINLNTGGTLRTDEMSNTGANGKIRFNGGTLAVSTRNAGRTPGDWIRTGNSVAIADGGAVIDTAAGSVTINRPLLQDGTASVGGLTKTGGNTLTLTALGTYAGDTLVKGGTLKVAPTPVLIDLVNAGFELPAYSESQVKGVGWEYYSAVSGWTFTKRDENGNGGIAHNGSPWVAAKAAPQGVQAGFLQRNCDMTQSIDILIPGRYKLAFKAANRPSKGADALEVKFGGVTVGSWAAATIDGGAVFKSFAAELGELQVGVYELRFVGTSPDGADRATAIDDVQMIRTAGSLPGSLPVGTHLSLALGTTLDLNGANQSLSRLSGVGKVRNSSSTNVVMAIGGGNQSSVFAGAIEGGVSLAKVGTGTVTISGTNSYNGATLVESGVLQLPAIGTVVPVVNSSFETHAPLKATPGEWDYAPADAMWVFSGGNSGIANPGAPWIAAGAGIDGSYAGFIQRTGSISGEIFVEKPGWYSIDFLAGERPGAQYPGTQLFVDIDEVNQFSFEASVFVDAGASFSGRALLPAGTHTLRFRGNSAVDAATWIDKITITSLGATLPSGTTVAVSEGAVLDLNGNSQSLAGVSGEGVVSNGTLAISGIIAPGGVNAIGTLTFALTPVLDDVTLLADVAPDGSGDRLHVLGDLDLSGLALEVADLDQLGPQREYTVASCTGTLSNRFSATNLPYPWHIVSNTAAGTVKITTHKGTLILLR